jgi:hypothetical protein
MTNLFDTNIDVAIKRLEFILHVKVVIINNIYSISNFIVLYVIISFS